MTKHESNHITSCTISWENTEDILTSINKMLEKNKKDKEKENKEKEEN